MTINVLITVLLASTLVILTLTRLAAERLIRQHYDQKSDLFHQHPVQPGDIVFLGDSITDGARWDELFSGLPVKNRGINGDTTSGVLQRLDHVLSGQPAAIFLLIGTNDLPWYTYHSDKFILDAYEKILIRCQKMSPHTRVFVQSIFPRHRLYASRIRKLNKQLEALACRYSYPFIDVYSHLVAPDGGIQARYSNDQLHLMAAGYDRWIETLKPFINNLQKT